jgi:hypothetical protein
VGALSKKHRDWADEEAVILLGEKAGLQIARVAHALREARQEGFDAGYSEGFDIGREDDRYDRM